MWFFLYAVVCVAIIVLHYTGWLAARSLEWLIWILVVTIVPAILWL